MRKSTRISWVKIQLKKSCRSFSERQFKISFSVSHLPTKNRLTWASTWSLGRGRSRMEPGLANKIDFEWTWRDWLKTPSEIKHCGIKRCPNSKFNSFSTVLVVSFSRFCAISTRLQDNIADLPSAALSTSLCSKETIFWSVDVKRKTRFSTAFQKMICRMSLTQVESSSAVFLLRRNLFWRRSWLIFSIC